MFKQIRTLMDEDIAPFFGEVEMDENYIGGKRRGHKRGRPSKDSHKVPVAGAV